MLICAKSGETATVDAVGLGLCGHTGAMAEGPDATTVVDADEARALFDYWRAVLMGSLTRRRELPISVGGYFFERTGDRFRRHQPIPLGQVRRSLIAIVNRADLTDRDRALIDMYYGLNGLPLPFTSTRSPDIAAGRDESTLRAACRAAVAATAPHIKPRSVGRPPNRPDVDPLQQSWFLHSGGRRDRARAVDRAYVRARARCDGPYAGPTIAALDKWYVDSGYADPDLSRRNRQRPNANAMARAAAIMELALHEELGPGRAADSPTSRQPAIPSSTGTGDTALPEVVTHPDLIALLHAEEATTAALLAAASTLQDRAVNGHDVAGQIGLLLRVVRPRLDVFTPPDLERLAVSVSYVATATANPFLAFEWLGHFLDRAGVTDRTFTVLVNASEAASAAGYHELATSTDQLFQRLLAQWAIPDHQIPLVERAEAEQQRLVASSYRLERLGADRLMSGDTRAGTEALHTSVSQAIASAQLAHRVLTDRGNFPEQPLPGKAGQHGGDLAWPWFLGAVLRAVEAASTLADGIGTVDHSGRRIADAQEKIHSTSRFAQGALDVYGEEITVPRFLQWRDEITAGAARLARWEPATVAS